MTTASEPRTFPSNWSVFKGAFGYISAGVACTLAGYALSTTGRSWPSSTEWQQFMIFWLFLGAGHANHAALYEQNHISDNLEQLLHSFARDVPIAMTIVGGIALLLFQQSHPGEPVTQSDWYLGLAAAVAPMGILGIHRKLRWGVDPKLSTFRSRSYFPALSTCLPAFLFGSMGYSSTYVLVGTSALILLLWFASLRTKLVYVVGIQATLLLLITILAIFFFPESSSIRMSIFGVFLTLAMGVSEAWRVTSRIQGGVEYRPRQQYTEDDASFYLAGTNVATAILLPLFLTTYLHPNTKPRYLLLVLPAVLIGYVLWFGWGRHADFKKWSLVAYLFGVSLPAILISGTQIRGDATFPYRPDLTSIGALWTLVVAMAAALKSGLVIYPRMYRMHRSNENLVTLYLKTDNCYELTQHVSAVLAMLGVLAVYLLTTVSEEQTTTLDRVSWITTGYLLSVGLIIVCRALIKAFSGEDAEHE